MNRHGQRIHKCAQFTVTVLQTDRFIWARQAPEIMKLLSRGTINMFSTIRLKRQSELICMCRRKPGISTGQMWPGTTLRAPEKLCCLLEDRNEFKMWTVEAVWYQLKFIFKSVSSRLLFYGGFWNKPLIPSFISFLLMHSNHKSLLFTSIPSQHPIFLCHPILCRFLPLFPFCSPHPSISRGVKWLRSLDALQLHVQTIRGSAVYLHF